MSIIRISIGLTHLKKYKLDSGSQIIRLSDPTPGVVELPVAQHLLNLLKSGVSALIIAGEDLSIRLSFIIQRLGIKVPDDISIMAWEIEGVSNNLLCGLSTIAQDFSGIAAHAVDILEIQQRGGKPENNNTLIDYKLILRNSIAFNRKRE